MSENEEKGCDKHGHINCSACADARYVEGLEQKVKLLETENRTLRLQNIQLKADRDVQNALDRGAADLMTLEGQERSFGASGIISITKVDLRTMQHDIADMANVVSAALFWLDTEPKVGADVALREALNEYRRRDTVDSSLLPRMTLYPEVNHYGLHVSCVVCGYGGDDVEKAPELVVVMRSLSKTHTAGLHLRCYELHERYVRKRTESEAMVDHMGQAQAAVIRSMQVPKEYLRVGDTGGSSTQRTFDELLAASSLGEPDVEEARKQADPAAVERVLERTKELDALAALKTEGYFAGVDMASEPDYSTSTTFNARVVAQSDARVKCWVAVNRYAKALGADLVDTSSSEPERRAARSLVADVNRALDEFCKVNTLPYAKIHALVYEVEDGFRRRENGNTLCLNLYNKLMQLLHGEGPRESQMQVATRLWLADEALDLLSSTSCGSTSQGQYMTGGDYRWGRRLDNWRRALERYKNPRPEPTGSIS